MMTMKMMMITVIVLLWSQTQISLLTFNMSYVTFHTTPHLCEIKECQVFKPCQQSVTTEIHSVSHFVKVKHQIIPTDRQKCTWGLWDSIPKCSHSVVLSGFPSIYLSVSKTNKCAKCESFFGDGHNTSHALPVIFKGIVPHEYSPSCCSEPVRHLGTLLNTNQSWHRRE